MTAVWMAFSLSAEAAKHELEMVKYALNNVDEEIYACSLDGTMEYANEQFRVRHDVNSGRMPSTPLS